MIFMIFAISLYNKHYFDIQFLIFIIYSRENINCNMRSNHYQNSLNTNKMIRNIGVKFKC